MKIFSVNQETWRSGDFVDAYANRTLHPVEVVILWRYREALSGRVLEIGPGAGRLLGYLVTLAREAHGLDISPRMLDYCRRRYPEARLHLGDLSDLGSYPDGPFDAICAVDNVLDVLDDDVRCHVLDALRGLLTPDGLLIFSSHNLDTVRPARLSALSGDAPVPASILERPVEAAPSRFRRLLRFGRRVSRTPPETLVHRLLLEPEIRRNRRRLGRQQFRAERYAVINDDAHEHRLLHYYIRLEDQADQLASLGYELIESLDFDGKVIAPGAHSRDTSLYYVARSDRSAVI